GMRLLVPALPPSRPESAWILPGVLAPITVGGVGMELPIRTRGDSTVRDGVLHASQGAPGKPHRPAVRSVGGAGQAGDVFSARHDSSWRAGGPAGRAPAAPAPLAC